MEDFHCIKQALGKRPNLSYFAIFDGHGGKDVASFLSINLHHFLIDEINNINFGTNGEENISNIITQMIKFRNSYFAFLLSFFFNCYSCFHNLSPI